MTPIFTPSPYLKMLSSLGLTTHPGGLSATRNIAERCHLGGHMKVLDVGCGMGHSSIFLAKNYHVSVEAIDPSAEMIEKAKALHQTEKKNIAVSFGIGDAQELLFEDEAFDLVICQSVLIFIGDAQKAVNEMCRVTKKGGFIALVEACSETDPIPSEIKEYMADPHFQGHMRTADEYRALITSNQFKIIHSEERQFSPSEQFIEELPFINPFNTLVQSLETLYKACVSSELRKEAVDLIKYFMKMPEGIRKKIGYGIFIGQK